jgi:hypothetical protein
MTEYITGQTPWLSLRPAAAEGAKRAGVQFAFPARSEDLELGCIPFSPSGRFPAMLFYASYLLSG